MNALTPITSVNRSCTEILRGLQRSLKGRGLRVLETFDLHEARLGIAECTCPQHGTAECDCQMVVLMVYGEASAPTTLTLHGDDSQTWLSLSNHPVPEIEAQIQAAVEEALKEIHPRQGL